MLQLTNITKKFDRGDGSSIVALDNVTAAFEPGEFCIVIGNNGSGKSTLLNAIEGTVLPDVGRVTWNQDGVAIVNSRERRTIVAKVHQNPAEGTAPTLTVAENLCLAMLSPGKVSVRRLVTKSRLDSVRMLLDELDIGMPRREDALVRHLSGGQRQGLAVHMAALRNPKVLLLDEHTAALDPDKASKIMELTVRLWRERNLTVLMVTHDLREAVMYGNRLICLSHGRIVLDVKGEEKAKLTGAGLFELFKTKSAEGFVPDSSFML